MGFLNIEHQCTLDIPYSLQAVSSLPSVRSCVSMVGTLLSFLATYGVPWQFAAQGLSRWLLSWQSLRFKVQLSSPIPNTSLAAELVVLSVNQETQQTLSLLYTVLLLLWHPRAPVKFHPRMEDPRSQAHELTSSQQSFSCSHNPG